MNAVFTHYDKHVQNIHTKIKINKFMGKNIFSSFNKLYLLIKGENTIVFDENVVHVW